MSDLKRGGPRPGAGRKKTHPRLKKTARTLKLPEWMWVKIDTLGSRPSIIEAALIEKHNWKAPKINT